MHAMKAAYLSFWVKESCSQFHVEAMSSRVPIFGRPFVKGDGKMDGGPP